MSKCRFQQEWVEKYPWLCSVPNDTNQARCKLCLCKFSLSNMGLRAVRSHKDGKKHKVKESSMESSKKLETLLVESESAIVDAAAGAVQVQPIPESVGKPSGDCMQKFLLKDDITRAEIIWCIQTVIGNKSLRSAEKDVKVFAQMFPDSDVAKKMQLAKSKMSYLIVHGLAYHFKQILLKEVMLAEQFVIGFDECFNKITQNQQMDLNIRFWDSVNNNVKTCYLTSVFLGRSTAKDLLEAFLGATEHLDLKKLLQLSMDGPNVNLKLFRELQVHIKKVPEDPEILTIGSCGLHALNVAFKTGVKATGWEIFEFFRALYYVFKDSPARRALFISLTESTKFPRKFCSVRWLENSEVAVRALEMLPHLKTFVKEMEKLKIEPKTKSYVTVKSMINDNMLGAKLSFFHVIASEMEGFLREYQSDVPLIPFLFSDLNGLLKGLMERFVTKSVLKDTFCMLDVDITDDVNCVTVKNIDVGISTLSVLKKIKAPDDKVYRFKKECFCFLKQCALKLQERSPLKYALTKAVTCFDPSIVTNDSIFLKRLDKLLLIMIEKNWISGLEGERAKLQLKNLSQKEYIIKSCKEYQRYSEDKTRIDEYWWSFFTSEAHPKDAEKVFKMAMMLSHGNANVERGFSVNSDCLWENMNEQSIVARRQVYDYVTLQGGLANIDINSKMLLDVKSARARYSEFQDNQQKACKAVEIQRKLKREATNKLKELEAKKAKILSDAEKESVMIQEEIVALRALQKK